MTSISIPEDDRLDRQVALGSETGFDFDFWIEAADDAAIWQAVTAAGVTTNTLLVRGIDYAVSGVNDPDGFSITLDTGVFPSGATAGHVFIAVGAMPIRRTSGFTGDGGFSTNAINGELQRITARQQEIDRDTDRSLRLPPNVTGVGTLLPADALAAGVLQMNGNGDGFLLSAGAVIHLGSGAPSDSLGLNGDGYLDPAAKTFYGPKAGGSWPDGVVFGGDVGPAGPAGAVSGAGDGTVGAPSIAFAADPDTGIYRPGANLMGLVANGTEAQRHGGAGIVFQHNAIQTFTGSGAKEVDPAAAPVSRFHSLTGDITQSFAATWAASGREQKHTMRIEQDATPRAFTWDAAVNWGTAGPPDLSTASKKYVLVFETIDNGAEVLGMLAGTGF